MNSILNVTYNNDGFDINEALVYKQLIDEGYIYPINELELTSENFNKFMEKLSKFKLITYDFSDYNGIFKQFKCDDFWMNASGQKDISVSLNCKSAEVAEEIFKIWKSFAPQQSDINFYINTFYMKSGSVTNNLNIIDIKEFSNVSDTYYPYIDIPLMCEQLFTNKENILILCGKPGTGKTKLSSQILKYAAEYPQNVPYYNDKKGIVSVAYVKNTEVLADDSFWRDLSHHEFSFVILDDLDFFLTSRDSEINTQEDVNRNKFINQFLSFTDGIENNKTKFIITTNQPFKDMDVALMRKGRLFDILELRELKKDEALNIWKQNGLSEKDFNFGDNVLQAELGSMIQKRLNKKVSIKNYITEENISKKQQSKKRVGF